MKTSGLLLSFITLPLLLLASFAMAGCTDLAQEPAGESGRHSALRFSLAVAPFGNGENGTRSEGNDFEKSIGTDDMVVLLFGEDEGKRGVYYGSDITAEEDGFLIPDVGRAADDISKIVVLANFGSGQDFGDVECLSDLRALKLPYEAVMSNQKGLPMSGMADCLISGDLIEVNAVEMVRGVAKIEIADCLKGYTITSATLSSYSSEIYPLATTVEENVSMGASLIFSRAEESDISYAYVPEILLGAEDSPQRKIVMHVKADGATEEETYTLWLKDYSEDGKNVDTPRYSWEQLERNYLYRFNVTTLEQPTPPTTTIQDKIEIRWYPTKNGKFATAYYDYLSYSTGVILLIKDNNNAAIKQYSATKIPAPHPPKTDFVEFHVDIDLNTLGGNIENFTYEIIDKNFKGQADAGYSEKWDENIPGSLLEDASRFGITQEEGKTILRLNTLPLQYITSPAHTTTFPSATPIRIYWRNPLISSIGNIYYNQNSQNIASISEILNDNSYNYIEFTAPQNCANILPRWKGLIDGYTEELYSLWPNHHSGTLLYTYDFIPMKIGGKDYLVFFVD